MKGSSGFLIRNIMTDRQIFFLDDIKQNASDIVELTSNRIVEIRTIGNYTTEEVVLKSIRTDMIDIQESVKFISQDMQDDDFADTSKMVPSDELISKFETLYKDWAGDETFLEYVKKHWNDEND